jgi:hypothetical protein
MDRLYDRDAPDLDDVQREVCTLPKIWHNQSKHPRSPYTISTPENTYARM